MRRFLSFLFLLSFTVPFGASLAGCSKAVAVQYCSGGDSGPVVGQTKSVILSPTFATYGESLNYGQIGSGLSASAVDCKGSAVAVRAFIFATSDMTFADINPATGQVCGGTWNRNTGGNTPDYTICSAPVNPPANTTAYVTATGDGVVSNPIPVYIHPIVTSIVIGSPTPAASCLTTNDPSTNCCPAFSNTTVTAPAYSPTACLSQTKLAQLTSRVYSSVNGTTLPSENITCRAGHVNYFGQNSSVLTIDQNGIATAQQPGSTIITASLSNSGSGGASGFFATCPPASIVLSIPNQPAGTNNINVQVNNSTPIVTTVLDTLGNPLSGLQLEYISTTPTTIAASNAAITANFPGTAGITAVCQPPTCNPAPFSQIGLFGNGKPLTSNGITATAAGANATVLYVASMATATNAGSFFLLPIDFSTNQQGSLLRLPYVPNSMVITQDGSLIYLGSATGLMTVTTSTNSVSTANIAVPGIVLAVSPDGGTVVVTDPVRQTVSLVTGGNVQSTFGGLGTRAQFSPDNQTVYVTAANNTLLVHALFTGWYSVPTTAQYLDVAVTVPAVGAFFATNTPTTEARTYCSSSTPGAGSPPVVANAYYPVANDTAAAQTDRVAATTDGKRILGATVTPTPTVVDITDNLAAGAPQTPTQPGGPLVCTTATAPVIFNTSAVTAPLPGITATSITGVVPASNSALAFITYTGTSGLLPFYVPPATGTGIGTVGNVTLSGGAASAPVAGVFATDNKTFYAGTSGDNQVHLITVTGATAADTGVIAPKLPDVNGNIVTPNLLVQKPKRAVS